MEMEMNESKEVMPKAEMQVATVNPEMLIAKAIENNLSVESLEKLLAMRKELKEEWSREQYYQALSQFQKVCPVIKKEAKVNFTSKSGKNTRYNYATLDSIVSQVRDILEQYGFSYTIKTKQSEKEVTAICESHHISGHSEITEFSIPIDYEAYMNAAQKVASALTYAKRYVFCNAYGIMTGDEDDDARGLSNDDLLKQEKENQKRLDHLLGIAESKKDKLNKSMLEHFEALADRKIILTEAMYKTDLENLMKL